MISPISGARGVGTKLRPLDRMDFSASDSWYEERLTTPLHGSNLFAFSLTGSIVLEL